MKTLLLIPAYNEEKNIEELVKKVEDLNYDYLIINDCSVDNTAKILEENKLNNLRLCNNMGIANVLQVGYMYAYENGYDAVATIDGDGQHNPEYLSILLKEIDEGYDYVIGSRFVESKKPFSLRMLGSRMLSFLIKIKTGKTMTDPTSGMKILGKNVLHEFTVNNNFIAEPDTVTYLLINDFKVIERQVSMDERVEGISHFSSVFASLKYMIYVIISILFIQHRRKGR